MDADAGGTLTRTGEPMPHDDVDPPALHGDRPLIAALTLALLLALALGTQWVAWRVGPLPALGAPRWRLAPAVRRAAGAVAVLATGSALAIAATAVVGVPTPRRRTASVSLLLLAVAALALAASAPGGIQPPWRLLVWQHAAPHLPRHVARALPEGWVVVAVSAVALELLVLGAWRRGRAPPPSHAHGSAYWGSPEILRRPRGLIVGRDGPHLLRLDGEGHILTVAPTRAGKGVSSVVPTLLDYPGSMLVTDPKGENYAVTARWRREMGQAVHALDPFGVVGGMAMCNPLDLVDAESPDAIDEARLLADMLVLPEGRPAEETFWNEEARALLTGLILHIAASAPPELRTLAHVRTLLTLAPEPFAALLARMGESTAAGGLVARAAARLLQKADRERSGVISTAQSHTHVLDSPRMTAALARSTVDLATLKRERATLYLVLPPDRLTTYARWLRLVIACALLAMTRTPGRPEERVLFLLDEFAHLGRMTPVARDIGLVGGYGVRFWLVVQDFSQLRATYGEGWSTFLANVDALQAFGTSDWESAEYLSKMTGETTVRVTSENRSAGVSHGRAAQRQTGAARTTAEHGRRLLNADEVRRLQSDRLLLFLRGHPPLLLERANYLTDPILHARADANPLYEPVVVTEPDG